MNAIDMEVIYQSTLQIARELTVNMLRTGYSTIIKESQDFTFAIFDAAGRMVAQGIRSRCISDRWRPSSRRSAGSSAPASSRATPSSSTIPTAPVRITRPT